LQRKVLCLAVQSQSRDLSRPIHFRQRLNPEYHVSSPENQYFPCETAKKELEKTMSVRKHLISITGIILTLAIGSFAQQKQTPSTTSDGTPTQERLERRERLRERIDGMRRHDKRDEFGRRGPGAGNLLRGIELTETQREQSRAIMQRRLAGMKAQREELFQLREKRVAGTFSAEDEVRAKALHQEMRTAMEGARTEMQSILTAEQKARIEELRKEGQATREQRKNERELRMMQRQELRNKPQ
jgi:Spy/CpxP family protein refolding chaperone